MVTLPEDLFMLAGGAISLSISVTRGAFTHWPNDLAQLKWDRRYWRLMTTCSAVALVTPILTLAGRESNGLHYALTGIFGVMVAVTLGSSIAVLHQIKTRMRA